MSIESKLYEEQVLMSSPDSLAILVGRVLGSLSSVRGCGCRGADVAPFAGGIVRCKVCMLAVTLSASV